MASLNIGVLGAGIVGITTALELQKTFRHANVAVIADKFEDETTSYVAAGIFRPGTSFSGPRDEITKKWVADAYSYWDALRVTAGREAGVTQISGYIFSSTSKELVRNDFLEHLVPIYRSATEEEKQQLCPPFDWKHGSFFSTLLTDSSIFIPWATRKFLQQASTGTATIRQHRVHRFDDLIDHHRYDVIVNCAGLGAKELCRDRKLVPIRGQVLKVENKKQLKNFFYADYDTYVIPGIKAVTLGGCRQYDSYDLNVSKYDSMAIRERCEALVPSLKGCKVLSTLVGLRPHRDVVRVEREVFQCPKGTTLKVVHNYGHGGYGVTTSPGTAKYAVELVKEFLCGSSKL